MTTTEKRRIDTASDSAPEPAAHRPRVGIGGPVAHEVSAREARKVAEAARETRWQRPSFGRDLFLGRLRLDLIDPWPQPSPESVANGAPVRPVDPGKLRQAVVAACREMGGEVLANYTEIKAVTTKL